MKRGFYTIMAAQFFSSLADNALLIAAIAQLLELDGPAWMVPLLKFFFTVSYVALAAFVGAFADAIPKGRVMFITNTIKVVGCVMMFFTDYVEFAGIPGYALVLAAYAVVGFGAAAYSPAKYGILTELLPPEKLVAANGWIEGLTVLSIILGTVLGGALQPANRHRAARDRHAAHRHRQRNPGRGRNHRHRRNLRHCRDFQPLHPGYRRALRPAADQSPAVDARFLRLLHRALEGQAGADLACGDHALLGSGGDLAVPRVAMGSGSPRASAGQGRAPPGDHGGRRRARRGDCGTLHFPQALRGRAAGRHRDGHSGHRDDLRDEHAGRLRPVDRDRRHGGLLRRADECAAAAPRLRAPLGRPFDRRAEFQREHLDPPDARHLFRDDQGRLPHQHHHRVLRHVRRGRDALGDAAPPLQPEPRGFAAPHRNENQQVTRISLIFRRGAPTSCRPWAPIRYSMTVRRGRLPRRAAKVTPPCSTPIPLRWSRRPTASAPPSFTSRSLRSRARPRAKRRAAAAARDSCLRPTASSSPTAMWCTARARSR